LCRYLGRNKANHSLHMMCLSLYLNMYRKISIPGGPSASLAAYLCPLNWPWNQVDFCSINNYNGTYYVLLKEKIISDLEFKDSNILCALFNSPVLDSAHKISKSRSHSTCHKDWKKSSNCHLEEWASYS
jgi:hypothetical protein